MQNHIGARFTFTTEVRPEAMSSHDLLFQRLNHEDTLLTRKRPFRLRRDLEHLRSFGDRELEFSEEVDEICREFVDLGHWPEIEPRLVPFVLQRVRDAKSMLRSGVPLAFESEKSALEWLMLEGWYTTGRGARKLPLPAL